MTYINQLKKRIDSDNKAIEMYTRINAVAALAIVRRSRERKVQILKNEYNIIYA